MAEVDFSDLEQAEAWLQTQSTKTRAAMVSRAATRVMANFRASMGGAPDDLDMGMLRAILTSAVRGSGRPADVNWSAAADLACDSALSARDCADSNYSVPYSAANPATHPHNSAGSAAFSALSIFDSSTSVTWAAKSVTYSAAGTAAAATASWDSANSDLLFQQPVWAGTPCPDVIAQNHTALLDALRADAAWVFWLRFYEGMWSGTFDDWDLAIEVIKIDKEDWKKGYEHIGDVIAGIEARLLADRARINERLLLDTEALLYTAETIPASNPERLARHLSRVEDALDDIVALGGGNGLTASTAEYRIITRLIRKYSADPERVAFDLTDVNKSISRQIEVGEYANDEPIKLLQAANTACVSFICEAHTEIEEELNRGLEPTEMVLSEQDILILDEAMRLSEGVMTAETAQTTQEDRAELLRNEIIDVGPEEISSIIEQAKRTRAIVVRRQISRLWQVSEGIRTIKGLAKKYETDHSKAAGYVMRVGGAGGILYAAMQILGRFIGLG